MNCELHTEIISTPTGNTGKHSNSETIGPTLKPSQSTEVNSSYDVKFTE